MFALLLAVTFSFHMKVTDAKTALLANPDFAKLYLPKDKLERSVTDRVVMLDRATGAHWVWLMFSWRPGKEVLFNTRGSTKSESDAAVGITPNDNETIRIRCLSAQCEIGTTTLAKGESKDAGANEDLTLTFR